MSEGVLVLHPDRGAIDDHVEGPGSYLVLGDRREPSLPRGAGPGPGQVADEVVGSLRRAVPDRDRGSLARQCPDRGPRRPARAEHERRPPLHRTGQCTQEPGGIGVLGADGRVPEAQCVRRADLLRRARGLVGDRERRLLVRDRDVRADESLLGHRPDSLGEFPRRQVARFIAPLAAEPERLEGGVLHRGRAGV